jgi:hypothetical protein
MDSLFPVIFLVLMIGVAVGMYKTFAKMGYDDAWWAFIPILNILFMLKVAEKPMWWIVLCFIPIVGSFVALYVAWLVSSKVAKAYNKGTGFAVGLLLLGFVFYPMLGFGSEQPSTAAA